MFWLLFFDFAAYFICGIAAQLSILVCSGGLLGCAVGVWLFRIGLLNFEFAQFIKVKAPA